MNRDGSPIRDISPSGRKSSEVQGTVKDVKLCLPLVVAVPQRFVTYPQRSSMLALGKIVKIMADLLILSVCFFSPG